MSSCRINREHVSHDLMEGEVIAIHLGTGIYYSLRGVAADIWRMLEAPATEAAIVEALAVRHPMEKSRLEADVAHFTRRLRDEGLIVEDAADRGNLPIQSGAANPYAPPELERYADLQDLLLLDPIHDVGAQGWPHRPERSS